MYMTALRQVLTESEAAEGADENFFEVLLALELPKTLRRALQSIELPAEINYSVRVRLARLEGRRIPNPPNLSLVSEEATAAANVWHLSNTRDPEQIVNWATQPGVGIVQSPRPYYSLIALDDFGARQTEVLSFVDRMIGSGCREGRFLASSVSKLQRIGAWQPASEVLRIGLSHWQAHGSLWFLQTRQFAHYGMTAEAAEAALASSKEYTLNGSVMAEQRRAVWRARRLTSWASLCRDQIRSFSTALGVAGYINR
jgi:hypothetical protein